MSRLPVIVGFGGINPAGRSSCHHGYHRMVLDALSGEAERRTYGSLAALMGLPEPSDDESKRYIREHTLVRKLEQNLFDASAIHLHRKAQVSGDGERLQFELSRTRLPLQIPESWVVEDIPGGRVRVTVHGELDLLLNDRRTSRVHSAGQLPTHFDPEKLYPARSHPRGLQLTVFAASDALRSLGMEWSEVMKRVPPDQVSVYASSAMGQLDENGSGGMLKAELTGQRVSSKNLALGLAEMTADFVNAYVLGNVGTTGANVGACATFLYNLRQGIQDIRSGKYRAVLVGSSEAPLTTEIMEGYRTMGALAEDAALAALDGLSEEQADHRRACRPFANNCGFTLSEAAQFVILFDEDLALEMGANIHGAAADVFINADGFKKSIAGPGVGNYITVGKAMGVVRAILGDEALRERSYMQAHGTSTPQNRVTEAHIFDEMARAFGIQQWPVAAIKSYLGHSLACASGDQLVASLGVWKNGVIPGITTTKELADDVVRDHLDFLLQHREVGPQGMDATLINSKGFGGNNATAAILAPHIVQDMLSKRHGTKAMADYQRRNEAVQENLQQYDDSMLAGENPVIYRFGEGVLTGEDLSISDESISIPGQDHPVSLNVPNPYAEDGKEP